MPPGNTRPVRVFRQDATRVGWLTGRRRRLTACGVQPVGAVQHVFEGFDVDGAVAPTSGERCFLEVPSLNAQTFQRFVDAFAAAFPDSLNLLRLDNSGAHPAPHIRWPEPVRCVWLPPYGPELNPMERVWRDLKDDRAWLQVIALEVPQVYAGDRWQGDDTLTLQALTGYPYLVEAIHALSAEQSHITPADFYSNRSLG
jgi:hypothetical protein